MASLPLRLALGLPALTLAILVVAPLAALVLGSSVEDVVAAASDGETLRAVATSVGCATAAVVLGLLLGVPTGLYLARTHSRSARLLAALLDLPVVIPHPIVGLGLLLVFGRNRLVGAALRDSFGIEVVSASVGIILAMLIVSFPFVVRGAREGFSGVPEPMMRAARSLGASELRAIVTVALPLAARSIRSGALLAWARSISEFGSIVILAYYPVTAPVLIWDRFSAQGLRAALAPALILVAVCLAIFLLLQVLGGRRPEPMRRPK